MNYVYVKRGRHLYECSITWLGKSTSEIGLELLILSRSLTFFMKTFINQEHNLPPDCAFESFTCGCFEHCMSGFSAFVLNMSKSGNILLRSMLHELFSSAYVSLVGGNSLVHELTVKTAVELHVNKTYYSEHPPLKSVYEKSLKVVLEVIFLL